MLIEFNVSNFRSIKERQTLSMECAGSVSELPEHVFFPEIPSYKKSLLKSVAIYGPNASGKSCLVNALAHMKHFIIKSAVTMQRGDEIQWVSPFKLDLDCITAPCIFEIVFIKDNAEGVATKYEYGFAITKDQIIEEWLDEYGTKKSSRLFFREYDSSSKKHVWTFGKKFAANTIAKRTSDNVLFLSKAAQENHPYLAPIFDWFDKVLQVILSDRRENFRSTELIEKFASIKPKILRMLKDADFGIVDIDIEEKNVPQISFPDSVSEEMREKIKKSLAKRLRSIHKIPGTKESVAFDFVDDESDGTKSILYLAKDWIKATENQQVIVIDELEKNLHSKLVRSLIEMFHSLSNGSQLIFTTHDVSQMDVSMFRRDQIVLTEKNYETQSTQLYRISDIKGVRQEHVLDRRYMLGAFGALPILGNFELEED